MFRITALLEDHASLEIVFKLLNYLQNEAYPRYFGKLPGGIIDCLFMYLYCPTVIPMIRNNTTGKYGLKFVSGPRKSPK